MTNVFSEKQLEAYLAGSLDGETRAAVELALESDDELAQRLQSLDHPPEGLREAFDSVLTKAPAYPPQSAVTQGRFGRQSLGFAAALVLGIGIGSFWGFDSETDATSDWKMAVANYQVLYVPETLNIPAPSPVARAANLSAMSEVLGRDLSAAAEAEGLDFRRAQILGLEGSPLIQMAYVSESGVPFAICVTRVEGADYAPRSETLAGLASAHWVDEGFGFVVIGGGDLPMVQSIAEDLSRAL